MGAFRIDTSEQFQHLDKAPIVEAVIELKGMATAEWVEDVVLKKLEDALPDYHAAEKGMKSTIEVAPDDSQQEQSVSASHRSEWVGFRFKHRSKPYLAQFERNSFFLSRLKPYENWEAFVGEALRLWKLHQGVANPQEIQRIGVRFVNLLRISTQTPLSDYLRQAPVALEGLNLPHIGFLHSDILRLPESPYYSVTINRTVQSDPESEASYGLIVDIDVSTDDPPRSNHVTLASRLEEMRWLKNKAFFGTLTPRCIEEMK